MSPLWSLAVEEQFYFIWPWVVLLSTRRTLRWIALAVIIVSPLLRAAFTPLFATHFPIYCLTIFRADTLAAGAFIALSETGDAHWIERHSRLALGCVVTVLVLLGGLSFFPTFRTGANSVLFNSIGYSLSVSLFGASLIYVLGIRQGILYNILTARPLRFLGLISYTFYLYFLAVSLKVQEHIRERSSLYWLLLLLF
jgi:peptidoglycan/LPS O-acetylase OafA/YrhL